MSTSRIFLIDAHALCYRAFYAVKELRNSKGQPTNAVFGFLNILRKLLKDHAPEYMAVCFDVGKRTKRQERYGAYKIQRPSMPEDLVSQIPLIKEIIAGYRIPIFEKEGYEADDVIATLAHRFKGHDHEVVIVSDDKDMYQLITGGIRIYSCRKEAIIGPDEAREKFGVTPEQMVDYLALAGDASDNIPGVDGIGEVTARKLIQEYGSLANVLKNTNSIKGKLKDKILNGKESAILSRELATLDSDVEINCSLEDIRIHLPDKATLSRIFEELEFKGSFVDATREASEGKAFSGADEKINNNRERVPVAALLDAVVPREVVKPVALGEIHRDVAVLIREAKEAGRVALWFDLPEDGGSDFFSGASASAGAHVYQLSSGDVEVLKPLLDSMEVVKIVYDLKNVRKMLFEKGLSVKGEAFDVLLAGYLLLSGQSSYEIEALSWTYLKRPIPDEEFSAHAVKALFDLEYLLRKDLVDKGADELYRDMELPLSQVLFEMEAEGVQIDVPFLGRMSQECDTRITGMTQKLFDLAGGEFNLNSPKQLGVILFDKLKLPVIKKTKTGYSTDEEVLTRLSPKHELPALILEYRQLAKLKSTYIDALPRLVSSTTGKLHCSFNQTGTETGRLSSNHPNLQNIPIRTDMGREIRKAFVPSEEGRVLVSADYSQIELRILAHLADEPALKKAFASGEDIHTFTAGLIFDVDLKDVTKDMRYGAKRINFGIIYGMSAFGLAKDLGVPNKEAQSFIDRYFLRYPGIKTFMENEIEKAKAQGYSETLLKRRRYLPDIISRNPAVRQFAERQAINTPVQGTAADLIKAAMVLVAHEINREKLATRMIITVHDELVFDVPQGELEVARRLIKDAMEKVVQLSVPIEVTVKVGKNWAEMDTI